MGKVRIRPALNSDAPRIVEIVHDSFREYLGVLDPPSGSHAETVEAISQSLKSNGAFIAELEEQEVGVCFYHVGAHDVYLFRLGVLPECRSCGIGRALIEAVERKARQVKLPKVRLETRLCLVENIRYYERLGYRKVGEINNPATGLPFRASLEKLV